MKSLKALVLAVAAVAVCAMPAAAQFRIGPRVGVAVNSMHLKSDVFKAENRAGFTGGVMCEFTVPVINVGFDLSVMYVHRVSSNDVVTGLQDTKNPNLSQILTEEKFRSRDYIEIPLHLKYKLGLPAIGNIITPYVFTGPSFAVLASKKAISAAFENKALDVAWDFGLGVQLIKHLQIGASYGLGMTNSVKMINKVANTGVEPVKIKNNCWTISAAWLF